MLIIDILMKGGLEMNELLFLQEHLPKLLLSAFIGGLVGLERGNRGGNIGLGTLSILTMSCCLATVLSIELSPNGEYMRVVAGILSSVGFIGGGVIFTQRTEENEKAVRGLTSASIVFFLAIIGITIGVGFYITAILVVILAETSITTSKMLKKKRKNNGLEDNSEF